MLGLLGKLREKIIGVNVQKELTQERSSCVDNYIALGVLLWAVAEADGKFLAQEKEQITEVLKKYDDVSDEDMSIVLRTIEEAATSRIDLFSFTKEVNESMDRDCKVDIVMHLFRVAFVDRDLDETEHETIRQISTLLKLDHQDFIESKLKVKEEMGL